MRTSGTNATIGGGINLVGQRTDPYGAFNFWVEIEGLIVHFWRSMRGGDPMPGFSPLNPDPTVAELGRHLDLMAGWTVRSAA